MSIISPGARTPTLTASAAASMVPDGDRRALGEAGLGCRGLGGHAARDLGGPGQPRQPLEGHDVRRQVVGPVQAPMS